MSIHPSLSSSGKTKRQRSVLKRFERLKALIEKGKWQEGNSVFGLLKVKTVKIRFKKEKAAPEKEEVAVAAAEATEGEVKEAKETKETKETKEAKTTEAGKKEKEEGKPKKEAK